MLVTFLRALYSLVCPSLPSVCLDSSIIITTTTTTTTTITAITSPRNTDEEKGT
jgi:hypothetical protein